MSEPIKALVPYGNGVIGYIDLWGRDFKNGWLACEHPERPTDAWVMWHYDGRPCRGCLIAAEALLMRHPEDSHVAWLVQRLRDAW